MKYLLSLILCLPLFAGAQSFVPADTCFDNTVTLITSNSARINTNTGNGDVLGCQVVLKYVRVGQTDTVTSSAAWPNGMRNLTGLQPGTQYVYYYGFSLPPEWVPQLGRYYFTTLTAAVVYATERSTVFPYVKTDSGFVVPRGDTSLYRQSSTTGGNLIYKNSDSTVYMWNKARWVPLMNSTSGISNKVDSVTVYGDSLYYWINGVSYGWVLPTAVVFDATVDFSVNTDPNTVGTTFSPNTPGLTTKIYVSTIDGSQWTYNSNLGLYVIYTSVFWSRFGNAGTTPGINFVGNTDNAGLMFKVDNIQAGYIDEILDNTSFGKWALNNSTQVNNIAFGNSSLRFTTTGVGNTAFGYNSLLDNTTGSYNIGVGNLAGRYQTTQANRLYLNSIDRTDIAGDTTKSIIYGAQDGTAALQRLYLNSRVYTPYLISQYNAADSMVVINPADGKLGLRLIPTGGSSGITVGTTTITSGTNTRVLYNNAGVVGEYPITGTGNVMLSASPTTTGTLTGAAAAFSGNVGIGGTGNIHAAGFLGGLELGASSSNTIMGLYTNSSTFSIANFLTPGGAANTDDFQLNVLGASYATPTGVFVAGSVVFAARAAFTSGLRIGSESGATHLFAGGIAAADIGLTVNTDQTITMPVYGAGTATFDGSGNITSVSDRRAKHNIRNFNYGLSAIMKINPSTFIYNQDESNTVMSGFIAQNVQQAIPIAVHQPKTKDGMMSLETNAIIAALVNAVKELKELNDRQQKQIDLLLKNK